MSDAQRATDEPLVPIELPSALEKTIDLVERCFDKEVGQVLRREVIWAIAHERRERVSG